MNRVAESSEDPSPTSKKPSSTRKPHSKGCVSFVSFLIIHHIYIYCRKSVTAEDDDNVSVADSSISVRVRRNEAERVEYFQNQPECGKMEPHHVQCLRCGMSVNLGRKQTYAVRPWEIHRARCDQKPPQTIESVLHVFKHSCRELTADLIEHPLRRKKLSPKGLHQSHPLSLPRLFREVTLLNVKQRRKERHILNPINRRKL